MREEFIIATEADTRLWNKYTSNTYEQLARLDNTVQDAGLFSGQSIIIEIKNEDGTWPRQARRYVATIQYTSHDRAYQVQLSETVRLGQNI